MVKPSSRYYSGVVNPKGMDDAISSTYFSEFQLKYGVENKIFNDLPIHIEHNTGVVAGGNVVHSYLNSSKQLEVLFLLNDDAMGKLCHDLINEDMFAVREMSMGYDIVKDDTGKVSGNIPKEISLVIKGDRPGTYINKSHPREVDGVGAFSGFEEGNVVHSSKQFKESDQPKPIAYNGTFEDFKEDVNATPPPSGDVGRDIQTIYNDVFDGCTFD